VHGKIASIIGSGINGNEMQPFFVSVSSVSLLLLEVELMETIFILRNDRTLLFKSLLLLEVELMETEAEKISPSQSTLSSLLLLEVELMETVSEYSDTPLNINIASIIGSGINGNWCGHNEQRHQWYRFYYWKWN